MDLLSRQQQTINYLQEQISNKVNMSDLDYLQKTMYSIRDDLMASDRILQKENQKPKVVNRLQSKTPPPLPKLKMSLPDKIDASTTSLPKPSTNSSQSARTIAIEPKKLQHEQQLVKEPSQKTVSNQHQSNLQQHQQQQIQHHQIFYVIHLSLTQFFCHN
jgi:hypothetical protein